MIPRMFGTHFASGVQNEPEALATERVRSKSPSTDVTAIVRFGEYHDHEFSVRNRLIKRKPSVADASGSFAQFFRKIVMQPLCRTVVD